MGPFGSKIKKENYRPVGVPVIRGTNLDAERFLDDGFVFVSEDKADELSSSVALPGDIVFAAQGTIGRVGIVPKDARYGKYLLSQNLMKVTCDSDRFDPLYVFYYFRSPRGQHEILSYANTTGVPCISRPLTSLRSFRVTHPPLSDQRVISSILGSLDDKIELNRRMNETLEEMARALFKSWFVDFDPVHAKMEGRQPYGMDEETVALFPDSFEDSALGKIPKGWKAGSLGSIADNLRRGVNPTEISTSTPYIGLEHMPRRSIALSEWGEAGQVGSNKSGFRRGEILFGKLRPYFHKVGVAAIDGVCSTDILVVMPRLPLWYGPALCHLSSDELANYADATSTGTKMPRAKWSDLALFQLQSPQRE